MDFLCDNAAVLITVSFCVEHNGRHDAEHDAQLLSETGLGREVW